MPDYKKILILTEVVVTEEDAEEQEEKDNDGDAKVEGEEDVSSSRVDDSITGPTKEKKKRIIKVNELAVSTEHAPFRHRSAKQGAGDVGSQRKKKKTSA